MHPFRHLRSRTPGLALLAGLCVAAAVASLPTGRTLHAQPPKGKPAEEEEDPKSKTVKKKIVIDDDPAPVAKTPAPRPATQPPLGSPEAKLDELEFAFQQATDPALKGVFARLTVPFDRITEGVNSIRVRPLPVFRTGPAFKQAFGVEPLDADGKPLPARRIEPASLRKVEHFEEVAAAEADAFLKATPTPAQLAAADTVLSAALRYHLWAAAANKRQGAGWDGVRSALESRLKDAQLQRLQAAQAAADWPAVRELGGRLAATVTKDPAVAADVAAAWLAEADAYLKAPGPGGFEKAREVLTAFEQAFPNAGGDAVRRLRGRFTEQAKRLVDAAKGEMARQNPAAARGLLRTAAALDRDLPGLAELQGQLRSDSQALYVGAWQVPERLTPAAARFDSERHAVELLFEGLLREVPDESGAARYRPAAAAAPPRVTAAGREFALRPGADWGTPDGSTLDAHDVAGTLRLLRDRPHTWPAAAAEWFDDRVGADDPARVRLALKAGHPDPRSLLTFKILPARWLSEKGRPADDPDFARQPLASTGPFRFAPNQPKSGPGPREVVFTENPSYRGQPGRTGQPVVREIRFVELAKVADPAAEMKADRLHLFPDVPTPDLDKYVGPSGRLAGTAQAYTADHHRRVHVLAVNHRRPALQSKDLRRGLSLGIDREAILNEVYRAGKPFHRAMTGPFPPTSWATPKDASGQATPITNRDLGQARLGQYLAAGGKADLGLMFAADDPLAAKACSVIKRQVEALATAAGRKLTVHLEPVSAADLVTRLGDEHRFDLAYVPFDYPDDWFPIGLGSYLDPTAAGRGGRNVTGYLSPEGGPDADDLLLRQKLLEVRLYRDFEQIVPRAHDLHRLVNDAVPFVPLWQLDRHLLVHNAVRVVDEAGQPLSPRLLNPALLFQGVERWRLD